MIKTWAVEDSPPFAHYARYGSGTRPFQGMALLLFIASPSIKKARGSLRILYRKIIKTWAVEDSNL